GGTATWERSGSRGGIADVSSCRMRRAALVVALLAPLAGVAPGGAQTTDTADIYAHAGANALAPAAARARSLVYVPNSHDGTVTVIDPATYRVVRTFPTGALPSPRASSRVSS